MTKLLLRNAAVISILYLLSFHTLTAQLYEKKIIEYVRMISEGRSDIVKNKVLDLQKKIPRAAGLIYIEGLIASNENEYIKCFNVIVDSFPHSEWADDALARLFEYHMREGKQDDAERNYQVLQSDFPSSPYLTTGYLMQERLSTENPQSGPPLSQKNGEEWAIQIGAFSIRDNAEKLRQRFASEGYAVNVYENLLDGKNLLYLVWVGSFPNADEARPLIKEIKMKYNIDGVPRVRTSWKKW